MTLGPIVIALFLLVYVALAVIALRRPLLGRLALREAIRRPGQSALIVLGLMVGTTAIYSMQLLSDSVVASESQTAYKAWSHVDLVAADSGRFFDQSVASGLAADPRVKSSTVGVQAGVELNGSVIDLDRDNAKPLVWLVGFDPAAQEPFGAYVLRDGRKTFGKDLAVGDVLLSASLADALQAQIGDRLTVATSPDQTAEVRVAGIAEASGPGAYGLRPAVFAPMISIRLLTGGPDINVIRVAAAGDGRAELDRAHDAANPIRTALAALPGGRDLRVREAKRDDIEAATATADATAGSIFTAFGLLVALAGVTLVVTLALALAEERRPRHAVLRALGLTRSGLIVLLVLEGGVYGAIAARLAPIPGALLGLFIVKVIARLLRTNQDTVWATQLQPAVEPGSVAVAVAIGGLITLAALLATAFRSSRMEISSAVKSLPEPPSERRRSAWWILPLGAVGLVGTAATVAGNPPIRLAGGAVLILIAAAAARAWLSARLLATLAGAALATWAGVSAAAVPLDSNAGLLVLALASPLAVFGLSLLLASNLRVLATGAGWLSGGMKATLAPSLAYLTRRPLRAGLGTGAFGLVLTLMTIITVFGQDPIIAETGVLDQYDIRVSAPTHPGLTLSDSVRSEVVRDIALPTRAYIGDLQIRINDAGHTQPANYIPLYALSRDQLLAAPFQLFARETRYRSDADVWQALASDPGLVMSTGLALGAELTLTAPDGPVHFRVAGILATAALPGLLGSEAGMGSFTTFPLGTTILAHTAPGADPRAVAREIQRDVFAQGGEAIAIQEVLDSLTAVNQALVNTLQLAVGLGLLVGVFSLGILALRAVIERRRSIGVLRALGYGPPNVLAGLLVEVLLTATSGAVIGIGVGLLMGLLLLRSIVGSASVQIDGSPLAWTLGLMYVAVLAVTLGPALRAARLAPSEALRVVD
jgi:putative ABC transport system permease protein